MFPFTTLSLVLVFVFSLQYGPATALHGSILMKNQMLAEMGLQPWQSPADLKPRISQPNFFGALNATNETIVPEYVTLDLDHFGKLNNQTFKNRFWVAEAAYKPGAPVFIYDVGEADAQPNALFRLQNETSFFKQLVDQFNGIGIVWEHRFYGRSSPYNISLDTPIENFKYHTSAQALADVPQFAAQFSRKNYPDIDLTPKGTPWVFVGGSYPGMRAAFMRKFYPDTIYASYASSAPVQAAVDMSFYFEPVWRGLVDAGWGNCTADIQAAVRFIDEEVQDPAKAAAIKTQFLGRGAGNNTNAGFADALTTIFYLFQSYGVEGGPEGLRDFCDWISTDPAASNQTSPASGYAAVKGAQFTVDRWASWPNFRDTVNDNLYTRCEGPNPRNMSRIPDCNLNERFPEPASISWTYQYCTEWGFMQWYNEGEHQLVSRYNDFEHQKYICYRQFPGALEKGQLPELPNVNATNEYFGGWGIRPSNTFWSGGEFDPWRTLSPLSDMDFAPHYEVNQDLPACNQQEQDGGPLFGYLIPKVEHAFDFRTAFAAGRQARDIFGYALTEWLRCWKPASATNPEGLDYGHGRPPPRKPRSPRRLGGFGIGWSGYPGNIEK